MSNVIASWPASVPGPNLGKVTGYNVVWTLNGAPAATVTVPQSASGDSGGYTADFNSGNPGVTLAAGDVVDCTVVAADTTDSLLSPPDTAPPITIPVPLQPPAAVASVTLTLA